MRKELALIEQIENYLMNKLNNEERITFEAEIKADSNLELTVEVQKNLVEGIQRLGLQNAAASAYQKYRLRKIFKWIGLSIATIAIIGCSIWAYSLSGNVEGQWFSEGGVTQEKTQVFIAEDDPQSCDANKYLDQQLFQLRTDRDTVIESDNGIVVYVPAQAFDTENDQIEFLLQEALNPEDILYAGLNTMTMDGDTLETGGMFYFDAFVDGERVALKKELLVDIPADPNKSGMELYDGVENAAGELLWTDPKPLAKPLIPTEITELDFYPKGYEPKMEEWGYLNKEFKDSLYYSFAVECFDEETSEEIEVINERVLLDTNVATISPIGMFMPIPQDDIGMLIDSISAENAMDDPCTECGVNPASVKTIWNARFNNTNLATKEFEERMPYIHQTCNNSILELYVRNLDKNLSDVDAMVAKRLGGNLRSKFNEFAERNDGRVEVSSNAQKRLNAYYQKKRIALQKAIEETNGNYWAEQRKLDLESGKRTIDATRNNMEASAQLNLEELAFNTDKVYDELGMMKPERPRSNPVLFRGSRFGNGEIPQDYASNFVAPPLPPVQPRRSILRANVNSMGWKNVDCLASTVYQRQDVKIRGNNRTTEISFSDLAINVESPESYQSVNVYVVPDQLNSYVKLMPINGRCNYRLNNDMTYQLVVLAWNGSHFFSHISVANEGVKNVELKSNSRSEWEKEIKGKLSAINNLGDEINYLEFAKKDFDRKNKNMAIRNLRDKARPFVFPCACGDVSEAIIIDEQDVEIPSNRSANGSNQIAPIYSNVDVEPSFPGGQARMARFISDNFTIPEGLSAQEANGTTYVSFIVDASGNISGSFIRQGVSPAMDQEALRVVSLMPRWTPGELNGNPVNVRFTIPISISTN